MEFLHFVSISTGAFLSLFGAIYVEFIVFQGKTSGAVTYVLGSSLLLYGLSNLDCIVLGMVSRCARC